VANTRLVRWDETSPMHYLEIENKISLGLGLSTDLDKWVVRPEVGYDGYFSIGIGAGIYPSRLGRAGSPTGELARDPVLYPGGTSDHLSACVNRITACWHR
jgi:hypothetical protein